MRSTFRPESVHTERLSARRPWRQIGSREIDPCLVVVMGLLAINDQSVDGP